ncbi:hypothetical protein SAMN05428963_12611 [Consotaella salsifontis]|uniref:Uncharacterized protein n=1 Tax=Consotaella salsifontis TaxID=1365950 RepID=A0A1T4TEU6_9HYPH|nr:hypothetical protein SAMN05428963_12611 [Consotaella salsifontis]
MQAMGAIMPKPYYAPSPIAINSERLRSRPLRRFIHSNGARLYRLPAAKGEGRT